MKHLLKTAVALILALSCIFAFAGCGDKEEEAPAASGNFDKTVIGEKAEGQYVYTVEITNATGYDITNFCVKMNGEATYAPSMLPEGDAYANGETRTLYFDAAYGYEYWASVETEDGEVIEPAFDIQITMKGAGYGGGDLIAVLHQFPFGDMTQGRIMLGDSVAYLQYTSALTGEAVSTLEAEQMIASGEMPTADPLPVVTENTQNNTKTDANSTDKNNKNNNKNNSSNNKNNNNNNNNSGNNNNNNNNNNNEGGNNDSGEIVQPEPSPAPIDYGPNDGGCIGDEGLVY